MKINDSYDFSFYTFATDKKLKFESELEIWSSIFQFWPQTVVGCYGASSVVRYTFTKKLLFHHLEPDRNMNYSKNRAAMYV